MCLSALCNSVEKKRTCLGIQLCKSYLSFAIDHFTVVGLVTWPLNGSEAGVDLVLIKTSLLLLCKSSCCYAN